MEVEYKGRVYRLRFRREHKNRQTDVEVLECVEALDSECLVAFASVRLHSGDRYSREGGRRAALKKLGANPHLVASEYLGMQEWPTLFGLLMQAYFRRPRTPDLTAVRWQIVKLIATANALEAEKAARFKARSSSRAVTDS